MRKVLIKTLTITVLLLISGSLSYALGSGTTAANFLKIPVGARAAAMGGAFTALADDGTALYWNPAGLARVEKMQLSTVYNMWFQGIKRGYLSLSFPLLGGEAGLGINYVDTGKIERRDEEGNLIGEVSASDILTSFGYAQQLSFDVMSGVSVGILQETLAENKKSTYLANFGLLITTGSFSLGAVYQNIGSNLGREDPLPFTYRAGVALKFKSFNIAVDAVKAIDEDIYFCAGLEWWIGNILALRAGYRTNQDIGSGVSGGIGLRISTINLDYAYVPYGELGNAQRISLGIKL
ncbi:PorV/PorQ family protein [Candidatus Aerophobetes bacterium]|nr:PorV/PorQ family protein [Candidatus Aerophobetes bacterium]